MDARLAETVFHGEHVVLGRRLRRLTYFHLFALGAAGSAFAGGPERVSFAELFFAVNVCSRSRAELHRWLPRQTGWRTRLEGFFVTRVFARHYVSELAAFHGYLRDHHAPPRFFSSAGGRRCKVPWPLPDLARLMRHGGFSLEEAWDMEPGLAAWLIPALQEAAGHEVQVMSAEEEKAIREAGHGEFC